MTKVSILDTGYAWNWLSTLNHFLDGISWGAGLVLVFIFFAVYVDRASKKSKKPPAWEGGAQTPEKSTESGADTDFGGGAQKLTVETGRNLEIDIKNAHRLANFVHNGGELAPIEALHGAIDRIAEAARQGKGE